MNNDETIYTAEEVARIFRVSVRTVWKKCRDRKWPHMKMGNLYRFTSDDLADIRDLMRPVMVRPLQKQYRPIRDGKRIPI